MSKFSIAAKMIDRGENIEALDAAAIASLKTAVGGVAKAAQNEWIRLAQSRLMTSREIYIGGLRQAESFKAMTTASGDIFEVTLVGRMPNNFEFGMEAFDMKSVRPGWLGGRKAKTAKDGHKYITIPFRHSEFGMPYTGRAAAIAAPTLKSQLRDAVRTYGLNRMMRLGSGRIIEGPVRRIPRGAPVHPYLQGLTRVQKGYSSSTPRGRQRGSSQLMTWRVMSEKSPPESWRHPGLTAANILPEVERFVDNQLDKILDVILGA
jgi:hypothetical protein